MKKEIIKKETRYHLISDVTPEEAEEMTHENEIYNLLKMIRSKKKTTNKYTSKFMNKFVPVESIEIISEPEDKIDPPVIVISSEDGYFI